MNTGNKYAELLERWFNANESEQDIQQLYEQLKDEELLPDLIDALEARYVQSDNQPYDYAKTSLIMKAIHEYEAVKEEKTVDSGRGNLRYIRKWGWVAAAIVLIVSIGSYQLTTKITGNQPYHLAPLGVDIAPGKNGAVLTLADGSQVVLDSLGNGVVANQNGAQVQLNNDELAYSLVGKSSSDVVYNVISTPNGRQFNVVLPDGTKVWLNAASALRFPTGFTGHERKVELTGEAYFEVAQNEKLPFKVIVNDKAVIEVLGTHFNVNGYENEQLLSTTLLEGRVRVHSMKDLNGSRNNGVILQPGQQANINQNLSAAITVINNANVDRAVAWKNGLFNFEGATLGEMMKQLERWYDITVRYEGTIPEREFQGKLPRNLHLSQVLRILDEMGIKTRLEGKVLIIE
ncbi:FecR family protein [Chitinophaga sp. Hz27]|uniref:FecR family protein n=1 Tax=Chitinophaga sp. Hz27 TaxID=3347169 RepID=UPI0035D60CEE